ncbi:MAG: hypothetical protein P9M14_18580 [Candidatus Alcyoniella australis]|nr:hypothetical protein [Candidatus Alcyoniella australis]
MAEKNLDTLCDLRTVKRNVKKGLVNKKDHHKFLKGLKDVATQAEIIDKNKIFGGEPSKIKGALVDHRVKQVEVHAPADYDELANIEGD